MPKNDLFISCPVSDLIPGEKLPVSLYIHVDLRFITYKAVGDVLTQDVFNRLLSHDVKFLFVRKEDALTYAKWIRSHNVQKRPVDPQLETLLKEKEMAGRKLLDIFRSEHPDKRIGQLISTTKKMALEIVKSQNVIMQINQLTIFSRGTVDHSINVGILSGYLAMQMGYTHSVILGHIITGGILHCVGRMKVKTEDHDSPAVIREKMKTHIKFGLKILDESENTPIEVKMIVAQFHERADGKGYPNKLRNNQIYDLAKIVSIANVFDHLVADGKGTLEQRQLSAVKQMEEGFPGRFCPIKLAKAIRILRLGI
jgi:putative nucleotidyltransferase with HDIG domain